MAQSLRTKWPNNGPNTAGIVPPCIVYKDVATLLTDHWLVRLSRGHASLVSSDPTSVAAFPVWITHPLTSASDTVILLICERIYQFSNVYCGTVEIQKLCILQKDIFFSVISCENWQTVAKAIGTSPDRRNKPHSPTW